MTHHQLLHLIVAGALIVATISAAAHTTILGVAWPPWALPALALWAIEPVLIHATPTP